VKALITGGTRGIGLETARFFREHGSEVWICGRDEKNLQKAARELNAKATVADVARPEDVARLFDEIAGAWGSLDTLVNNAADIFVSPVAQMELERVRRLFDVNVMGLMDCCRHVIPLLRKGESPAIVNVASISGIWGRSKFVGFGAYNASKFAVLGLTEVLALELRKEGIRVNAISPGSVDTDMFHQNVPKEFAPAMTAREVAEAIWFLATASSRPMSGRNLELF
jgi:NAD(P)-dependent dehydrogenase (short-subunit alcohol dehydrogenase family)